MGRCPGARDTVIMEKQRETGMERDGEREASTPAGSGSERGLSALSAQGSSDPEQRGAAPEDRLLSQEQTCF